MRRLVATIHGRENCERFCFCCDFGHCLFFFVPPSPKVRVELMYLTKIEKKTFLFILVCFHRLGEMNSSYGNQMTLGEYHEYNLSQTKSGCQTFLFSTSRCL